MSWILILGKILLSYMKKDYDHKFVWCIFFVGGEYIFITET